ncbi:hypothetical protein BCR42DRAFT_417235 [Absidia repens]|uniref:Uncharacterized protein n=1 Tax=Absidia repens TaxID=90262 RepID=A0A1X2IDN5_9FUNG|nr:hypothetical protein BCR42DRAFT_417235 [Absidia repens]
MTTMTFSRSTSLSSFVKQLFFLGSSTATSTSATTNSSSNDAMNNSSVSYMHNLISPDDSLKNNSNLAYERCSFHQEYVSFPSLDELEEQYKEPPRFMVETQTVLC